MHSNIRLGCFLFLNYIYILQGRIWTQFPITTNHTVILQRSAHPEFSGSALPRKTMFVTTASDMLSDSGLTYTNHSGNLKFGICTFNSYLKKATKFKLRQKLRKRLFVRPRQENHEFEAHSRCKSWLEQLSERRPKTRRRAGPSPFTARARVLDSIHTPNPTASTLWSFFEITYISI